MFLKRKRDIRKKKSNKQNAFYYYYVNFLLIKTCNYIDLTICRYYILALIEI